MRVLSVIHQPNAHAGVFADVARAGGAQLVEWNIAEASPPAPPDGFDAVMVFGGTPNPDEDEQHPWLRDEVELLRGVVDGGVPLFCVCLGAEMLARTLGGGVGPIEEPEFGWFDVELTAEGEADPVLGALPRRFTAFQAHGYGFDLPPGAVPLARSGSGLQAFRAGEAAWGVQFHPEVTPEMVTAWARTRAGAAFGDLSERSAVEAPRWAALGGRLCSAFLTAAS